MKEAGFQFCGMKVYFDDDVPVGSVTMYSYGRLFVNERDVITVERLKKGRIELERKDTGDAL